MMKKTEVPRSRYGHRTPNKAHAEQDQTISIRRELVNDHTRKEACTTEHASQRSKELDVVQGVGRNHAIVSKTALL